MNSDVLNPCTDVFFYLRLLSMFEVKTYKVAIGSYIAVSIVLYTCNIQLQIFRWPEMVLSSGNIRDELLIGIITHT